MSRCQGYATNLGFSSKTAKLNIHKFTMMLRISLPLVLAVCHQIRLLQVLSAYSPLQKQPPVSIKKVFFNFWKLWSSWILRVIQIQCTINCQPQSDATASNVYIYLHSTLTSTCFDVVEKILLKKSPTFIPNH